MPSLRFTTRVVACAAAVVMFGGSEVASAETRVLFLCPHGAAKSVLASSHFARLAKERGLRVRVDFAGTEPDPAVSPAVADLLKKSGTPVPAGPPRRVTPDDLGAADLVISLGCDLGGMPVPAAKLRNWDVPPPGVDLAKTDEAILQRVNDLVEELIAAERKTAAPVQPR
jgi:arsenate reductase